MGSAANINKLASQTINKTVRWISTRLQQRVPYSQSNPFLEGAYAPVAAESTCTDLKVSGSIPSELNGLFLRMGPNPMEVDNPAIYNWFIGDGMAHALRLKEGQAVWYKNRYVGVDSVNKKLGKAMAPGPRRGPTESVNTNIIGHAGKIWALVEAGAYPVQMDADLNTIRHGLFNSDANLPFTAHPHIDPDTGDIHAVCYDALQRNKVFYLNIDRDGHLKKQLSIPVKHGPMMHDCTVTQSKVIILDLPITFSFLSVFKGSQLPYAWNKKHAARVGVLPKNGQAKDIRWFEVDPCFIFHTCNAYDLDNGDVVMDAVVHTHSFSSSIQGPAENQKITFERWTLKQQTGQVERQVISDVSQEFPRLDERLTGKPYRYAYAISLSSDLVPHANALLRYDLHTGETIQHHYGTEYMTGEVVFVPRHKDAAEDEGWLLSYVHHLDGGPSKIVILDAQKIEQAPQATIELPVRVPLGFHANWVEGV